MTWHFLGEDGELCTFSPVLAGDFSPTCCLATYPSALLKLIPTAEACCSPGSGMECFTRSRSGTTCAIVNFMYQHKMYAWTKNTDTAKCVTALSAANHSLRETRAANSNAARMLAVACYKQGRRKGCVQSAGKISFRLGQDMKRAPAHAGLRYGYHVERLIRWSRSGSSLPSFPVRSSPDASATRQIEQRRCSAIQLKNSAHTLRRISSPACRGAITGKGLNSGA